MSDAVDPHALERLLAVLGALDLPSDALAVAEALWLAARLPAPPPSTPVEPAIETPRPERPAPDAETSAPAPPAAPPARPDPASAQPTPGRSPTASIATRSKGPAAVRADGRSVRVPAATALPRQRELARALRPLKRRALAPRDREIDLAATIDRCSETGLWVPVWRPGRGRWLDLALVVDVGRSMDVWRRTGHELHRLLAHAGAFGKVTAWSLDTGSVGRVVLRAGLGGAGPVRAVRELLDSDGRRAVLLLTDCVSPAWHGGGAAEALRAWGAGQPTGLLQVLARPFWLRTGLRHHYDTVLSARSPGRPNAHLASAEPTAPGDVALPAIALGPRGLGDWAWMMAGRKSAEVPGVLLEAEFTPLDDDADAPAEAPTGAARVAAFRSLASRPAWRLALVCAAAPVVSLPVLRILRQTLVPEADTRHLAEVLLGGLLREVEGGDERPEPDDVLYELVDGAREAMLADVPVATTLDVMRTVSEYVARECGAPVDFGAVVRGESSALQGDAPMGRVFARVATAVLRALGAEAAPEEDAPTEAAHETRTVMVVCSVDGGGRGPLEALLALLGRRLAEARHRLVLLGRPGPELTLMSHYEQALREAGVDPATMLEWTPQSLRQAREQTLVLEALAVADCVILLPAESTLLMLSSKGPDHIASIAWLARRADVPCVFAPCWDDHDAGGRFAREIREDASVQQEVRQLRDRWREDPAALVDVLLRFARERPHGGRRSAPSPADFDASAGLMSRSICAIVDPAGVQRGTGFLVADGTVLTGLEALPDSSTVGWTAAFTILLKTRTVRLSFPLNDFRLDLASAGVSAVGFAQPVQGLADLGVPLRLQGEDGAGAGRVAWFSPSLGRAILVSSPLHDGPTSDHLSLPEFAIVDGAALGAPVLAGGVMALVTRVRPAEAAQATRISAVLRELRDASGYGADQLRSVLGRTEGDGSEHPPQPRRSLRTRRGPLAVMVVFTADESSGDALLPLAEALGRRLSENGHSIVTLSERTRVEDRVLEVSRLGGTGSPSRPVEAPRGGAGAFLEFASVLTALSQADVVILLKGPTTDAKADGTARLVEIAQLAQLTGVPFVSAPWWDYYGSPSSMPEGDPVVQRAISDVGDRWLEAPYLVADEILHHLAGLEPLSREGLPIPSTLDASARSLDRSLCAIVDPTGAQRGTGFLAAEGVVLTSAEALPTDAAGTWRAEFVVSLDKRSIRLSLPLGEGDQRLHLEPIGVAAVQIAPGLPRLASLGVPLRLRDRRDDPEAKGKIAWFSRELGHAVHRDQVSDASQVDPSMPPRMESLRGAPILRADGGVVAMVTRLSPDKEAAAPQTAAVLRQLRDAPGELAQRLRDALGVTVDDEPDPAEASRPEPTPTPEPAPATPRPLRVMVRWSTSVVRSGDEFLPLADALGRGLADAGHDLVMLSGWSRPEDRLRQTFDASIPRRESSQPAPVRFFDVPISDSGRADLLHILEALAFADVVLLLTGEETELNPRVTEHDRLANLAHLARLARLPILVAPGWQGSGVSAEFARAFGTDPDLQDDIEKLRAEHSRDPSALVERILRNLAGGGHQYELRETLPRPYELDERERQLAGSVCEIVDTMGNQRGTGFLLAGDHVMSSSHVIPRLPRAGEWRADFVVPLKTRCIRLSFPLDSGETCVDLSPPGATAIKLLSPVSRVAPLIVPLRARADLRETGAKQRQAVTAWFSPERHRVVATSGTLSYSTPDNEPVFPGLPRAEALRGAPVVRGDGAVIAMVVRVERNRDPAIARTEDLADQLRVTGGEAARALTAALASPDAPSRKGRSST